MPDNALKCSISVEGGIIPGLPIPEYTKQWILTSKDMQSERAGFLLLEKMEEASKYAISIQNPAILNWVKMQWIWY
jgi:hypothetical protein